jgi:primosomal protein N' (replication factor Y)
MISKQKCILRIVLSTPLRHHFDYLPPREFRIEELQPGVRVRVPFGKYKERIGLLLKVTQDSDVEKSKLKRISKIIDKEPVLSRRHLALLEWASTYYHHPIGEVFFNALPKFVRQGKSLDNHSVQYWRITHAGEMADSDKLVNAPVQSQLLDLFRDNESPLNSKYIQQSVKNWRIPLQGLIRKGLIEICRYNPGCEEMDFRPEHVILNSDQQRACDALRLAINSYQPFLLDGVTGSGKTEVYMHAIQHALDAGKQALVLLPEIGLTPQLITRFKCRFKVRIAMLHSAMPDRDRLQSWIQARDNEAKIILGARSAIWIPLSNPGIYIVDEEHDPSYKQQDGFRYSARDMALIRAKRDGVPVVLGSATPSMESMQNAIVGRYQHLLLPQRAGDGVPPRITILDIRGKRMHGPIAEPLLRLIKEQIQKQRQILLFLNRRGYASIMLCHHCGWAASCTRCDLPFTYHKLTDKLRCHHCGSQKQVITACPKCKNTELLKIGHGTERIEEILKENFPEAIVLRIDRDTTRRKGSMQSMLASINSGEADILIGTQMLAKGHHFPRVTLAGIIDADRGLFSADFRASERMAQLLVQVSGRAGRSCNNGQVIIQTHYPEHDLLTTLVEMDYSKFSRLLLSERKLAHLPPFSYLALLRAESHDKTQILKFLNDARSAINLKNHKQLEIFGPVSAPLEKRIGRFRMQLLIQSTERNTLRRTLSPWMQSLEKLTSSRKVRWSLDVDPQDML